MNKLTSIYDDIRFSTDTRTETPADLQEHILHLTGLVIHTFPPGAIFFTKEERLAIARAFVELGNPSWCNSYLPLYFVDKRCNQMVVIDSETKELSDLDFYAMTTFYSSGRDGTKYRKVVDIEKVIKGDTPLSTEESTWSYTTAVVVATASFFLGMWAGSVTSERSVTSEAEDAIGKMLGSALSGALSSALWKPIEELPVRLPAELPEGLPGEPLEEPSEASLHWDSRDTDVCTLFQMIGHSH